MHLISLKSLILGEQFSDSTNKTFSVRTTFQIPKYLVCPCDRKLSQCYILKLGLST